MFSTSPRSGLLLVTILAAGLTGCKGPGVNLGVQTPGGGLSLGVGGRGGANVGASLGPIGAGLNLGAPSGARPASPSNTVAQAAATRLPVEPTLAGAPAAPSNDSQAPASPDGVPPVDPVPPAGDGVPSEPASDPVPAAPPQESAGVPPAEPAPDAGSGSQDAQSQALAGMSFADLTARQTGATEAQRRLQAQRVLDTMEQSRN